MVPKYALRPGYQVCYTVGLRSLLQLKNRYAPTDGEGFARRVLAQGEIGFVALEAVLREGD